MLLLDFLSRVFARHHLDVSRAAMQQYSVTVRRFGQMLGRPAAVDDLTASNLADFMLWMKDRGLAAATVNGKRAAILTIWREAARRRLCQKPDMDEVPTSVREPKRLPNSWTIDNIAAIVTECRKLPGRLPSGIPRELWWSSLVLFLYDSGARLSAALEMTPSEIDLSTCTAILRSESAKTGLEQWVSLSDQTALLLHDLLRHRQPRVWPWGRCRNELYRTYGNILDRVGLPSDRRSKFHRIRRTTATLLTKHGTLQMAQQALGHTSEKMTLKYVDPRQLNCLSPVRILPRPEIG